MGKPTFYVDWGDNMEETVKKLVTPIAINEGLIIDSVIYEKEDGTNFLRIGIDRDNIISMDVVVGFHKKIKPVLDEADLIEDDYMLEVYAKTKGDVE